MAFIFKVKLYPFPGKIEIEIPSFFASEGLHEPAAKITSSVSNVPLSVIIFVILLWSKQNPVPLWPNGLRLLSVLIPF